MSAAAAAPASAVLSSYRLALRYNGVKQQSAPSSTITYKLSSVPSRAPCERAAHESISFRSYCKFCWGDKKWCGCKKLAQRKECAWMIGLIGRDGGKGQSVLSCDDELRSDGDDGACDGDVEGCEAAAEEFAECDAFDNDSGAGAIEAEDCSSCVELSWEQVDVAEVESCCSSSLGISSEDECMSEGDSSHLSSFDDVSSSSSSSSYDACLSDGDLEWGGGE